MNWNIPQNSNTHPIIAVVRALRAPLVPALSSSSPTINNHPQPKADAGSDLQQTKPGDEPKIKKWWFEGQNCWYSYDAKLQRIFDANVAQQRYCFEVEINGTCYFIDLIDLIQVQKNDHTRRRHIKLATEPYTRPARTSVAAQLIAAKNFQQPTSSLTSDRITQSSVNSTAVLSKPASADDGVRNRRRYSSSDDDDDDEQSQSPMDSQTDQQSDSDKSFVSTIFTQLKDYLKISTKGAALLLFTMTHALIMMMPGMPIIAVSIAIVLSMIYLRV